MPDIRDNIVSKLPLDFRADVVQTLARSLESHECSTFIFMPGVGKHRIARFLVYRNNLGDILKNYSLYLLNCTEDQAKLLKFLKAEFYKDSKERPVLVLNDIDLLFDADEILDLLFNLRREHGILLTSFSSAPLKFDLIKYHALFSRYDFLSENIIYSPPSSVQENATFIEEYSKVYKVGLDDQGLKTLADLSGGNQTLSYQILRLIRDNKILSSELPNIGKIFEVSEEIKLYCKEVVDSLEDLSQSDRNKDIGFYLNGAVFSTLINYYLNVAQDPYSNSDNEVKLFTRQELMVYNLLNLSNGHVITRDAIADLIWGEESSDKYSDWAIDTLMKNIRKKLEDNNLGVLKTKRGIGYYLERF